MRCSALCLLLCAALVSGAPNLLPGDPRLSDPSHHGEHDHAHGEHDHAHGEHDHAHGEHDHAHGEHDHTHGEHAHDGHVHPDQHAHPDEHSHPDQHARPDLNARSEQDAFPEQNVFPDQLAHPPTSLAQGIPDVRYVSGGANAGVVQVVAQGAGSPSIAPQRAAQPAGVPARRPSNPFLSGTAKLPSSSSFQVAVQPVLPPAQRPTPEPIKEVNTNPLGGPAGPKGPVQPRCPGPVSALPCVLETQCDPYTGFLKSDGIKLPYPITKDTPTVAIGQCKLGGGVGVCCKKFPRPAPTVPTTAVPLGVDYGQGLEHLKPKPTQRAPNPFLPGYNPSS